MSDADAETYPAEYQIGVSSLMRAVALSTTTETRIATFKLSVRGAIELARKHYISEQDAIDRFADLAASTDLLETFGIEAIEAAIADARNPAAKPNGHDATPLQAIFPLPIDRAAIPPRDWIVPGLLMRRHVTVLVAPSGSGKSLLTLQLGLACAQGKPWAGWLPRRQTRFMVINSEDDIDEMRRRISAATEIMRVDEIEIRDRVVLIDNSNLAAVVAKVDAKTKTMVRTPLLENLVTMITRYAVNIVFVDPFAETFEGDENSNSELKWAGVLWREVARRTNAAVCLVHHTKKYASSMAGDVDAARGAGALIGIARIVATLFPMTQREAEVMLSPAKQEQRGLYLRYDDAKANLNLKSPFAKWFHKNTINLGNALDGLPGDDVGVLVPWKPDGPNVLEDQIVKFFRRVDQGVLDQDGKPTGEYYAFGRGGSKDRSVIDLAQEFFNIEIRANAEKLIDGWKRDRRLEKIEYRSPHQRRTRGRVISELDQNAPKNRKPIDDAPQQFEPEFDYDRR